MPFWLLKNTCIAFTLFGARTAQVHLRPSGSEQYKSLQYFSEPEGCKWVVKLAKMADTHAAHMELSEAEQILMNIMKQTDESCEEVTDEEMFLYAAPHLSVGGKTHALIV